MEVPEALVVNAARVAEEINADAILILTESGKNCAFLARQGCAKKLEQAVGRKPKLVVATPNRETYQKLRADPRFRVIKLVMRAKGRGGQISHAIARGLQGGVFSPGERVVCLTGDGFADATDTLLVRRVMGFEQAMEFVESDPVLSSVVEMAIELGRGGPSWQPIGAAFVVGDSKAVMRLSHQLGLNPFRGYSIMITDRSKWEAIKKYAALDGAVVIDGDGRVLAAERRLTAEVKVDIPRGLGTRHLSVAAMTALTKATGVTVSGENGVVRIFRGGALLVHIDPISGIFECQP